MRIAPLSDVCGAEVTGFDCGADIDQAHFQAIRAAFNDHSVLIFRDQHLTPEQHIGFSRLWGDINGHILTQYLLPGYPELLVVSNRKDDNGEPLGIEDAGRYWHTDVSYDAIPPMGSLLYGLEIPAEGGDTLFASQYRAYDNLPQELKDRVSGLTAHHRFNYSQIQAADGNARKPLTDQQKEQLVGAVHPIVRTHPDTGRRALYVNPGFTDRVVDMEEGEGQALLATLFGYATDDAVVYRHTWHVRDLVFWDNRCLMHHATSYPADSIRHMNRTTVAGSVPA